MLSWRAPLVKCILPHCKCTDNFCHFWGNFYFCLHPLCFALSDFASPFSSHFSLSSILRCFHLPYVASIVRRLYPGQLWHHPVTWLPRLLPSQPELHVDNRDLPWQRLAEKSSVNTCSSQIQFPLQCHFPLLSGLFILPNNLSVRLECWEAGLGLQRHGTTL